MPYHKWDPFADLVRLHEELFGAASEGGLARSRGSAWRPPVDIYETAESFIIKAELPGIEPEEVNLEHEDTVLRLWGERPDKGRHSRKYHRLERIKGPFERVFRLPDCIEGAEIEAEYRDGVLEIKVPKTPESQPRCIPVQGG